MVRLEQLWIKTGIEIAQVALGEVKPCFMATTLSRQFPISLVFGQLVQFTIYPDRKSARNNSRSGNSTGDERGFREWPASVCKSARKPQLVGRTSRRHSAECPSESQLLSLSAEIRKLTSESTSDGSATVSAISLWKSTRYRFRRRWMATLRPPSLEPIS